MANTARRGHQHFLAHRILVAGIAVAGGFFMRPVQLEAGLVVVEIPGLPVPRVVTDLAFGCQSALMHIVFLMARPAIRPCILESYCGMALFAFDQHVPSKQRKRRHPIVVERGLVPGLRIMAGVAFLALLPLVLVVLFMARRTVALQLVLIQITLVACRAFGLPVLAELGAPAKPLFSRK